ncbi:MAG: hypothetical protein NWE82_03660 [Candidatus Bathyarchaeota archaeon]|nr:hypothetical protein [Candidatus Bathyarchaeota archaeon]
MSEEEDSTWFTIAEKFFGLLVILIGAIIVYAAVTSSDVMFSAIFATSGLSLIIVGAFMFLAKAK